MCLCLFVNIDGNEGFSLWPSFHLWPFKSILLKQQQQKNVSSLNAFLENNEDLFISIKQNYILLFGNETMKDKPGHLQMSFTNSVGFPEGKLKIASFFFFFSWHSPNAKQNDGRKRNVNFTFQELSIISHISSVFLVNAPLHKV